MNLLLVLLLLHFHLHLLLPHILHGLHLCFLSLDYILLLNLDYWRMHGVERQCREHYQAYPERIVYNDQDLLNSLLHDRRKLLDMKWNVQEGAYRLPKKHRPGCHCLVLFYVFGLSFPHHFYLR